MPRIRWIWKRIFVCYVNCDYRNTMFLISVDIPLSIRFMREYGSISANGSEEDVEYSRAPVFTTRQIAGLKEQGADFRFALLSIEGKERQWALVANLEGVDHVLVVHSEFTRRIFKSAKAAIELWAHHFPENSDITLPISQDRIEKMARIKITI